MIGFLQLKFSIVGKCSCGILKALIKKHTVVPQNLREGGFQDALRCQSPWMHKPHT